METQYRSPKTRIERSKARRHYERTEALFKFAERVMLSVVSSLVVKGLLELADFLWSLL